MNLRDLLEMVAAEEERDSERSTVMREGKAIEMIGRALHSDARSSGSYLRQSDRRKLERNLDELDMAVKKCRAELKKWPV